MQSIESRLLAALEPLPGIAHELLNNHSKVIIESKSFELPQQFGGKQVVAINRFYRCGDRGFELQRDLEARFNELDKLLQFSGMTFDPDRHYVFGKMLTEDGAKSKDSPAIASANFAQHICSLRQRIMSCSDEGKGETLLYVDTNSLVYNPDIERWRFDDFMGFTVVLGPTVLSELDKLKAGKNERVAQKAEKVIRKIKEYGRRGDWHTGVKVAGDITLRLLPYEPSFDAMPSWLEPTVNDDRIIAGAIQLIRAHPRCPTGLVTRDINMQNKAKFARLEYLEPPEPAVDPP